MSNKSNKVKRIEISCCWNCSNRRLLTIKQAADLCNVSLNTLYVWMKQGIVEWVYNAGGKPRIYWDSLVWRGLVAGPQTTVGRPEAA